MSKEQLIRKLSSRKFILTVALLIFSILCITGVVPVNMQEEWKGIIVIAAGVVAYIFGESATDVVSIIQENEKEDK